MERRNSSFVLWSVWTLYAIALFLPVSPSDGFFANMRGYDALLLGWSLPNWMGSIPELANICLILGSIALYRQNYGHASVIGVLGVILAGTAPLIYGTPPLVGYWLWISSIALLAVAAVTVTLAGCFSHPLKIQSNQR